MVINITLGFAMLDRLTESADCGFVCVGLTGAVCANAEHPADRAITTASERLDKKVERRPNMRLMRRWLLLRAPRLLVCFGRKSLSGQPLG